MYDVTEESFCSLIGEGVVGGMAPSRSEDEAGHGLGSAPQRPTSTLTFPMPGDSPVRGIVADISILIKEEVRCRWVKIFTRHN